jgi:putative FmdB family regulatory protein
MPLYDYRCKKCGETFEVMRKFSDAPLTVHEGCGGEVSKLLSAPSFHLKGSGWYATDYGKNGKLPASNGKSEKSESKSETKSETKTETKSETKSETKPSPAKSE